MNETIKKIGLLGAGVAILIAGLMTYLPGMTEVTLNPVNQTVIIGDPFSIYLNVTPAENIAGMQTDMVYNSSIILLTNISEGNLLIVPSKNTSWFALYGINNTAGLVKNIVGVIIGNYSTNKAGTFIKISGFGTGRGKSNINMTNVKLSTPRGTAVTFSTANATVIVVAPPWDINEDDVIDSMDLNIVASHIGSTSPGRWDTNNDGVTDILDLVRVASCFGG